MEPVKAERLDYIKWGFESRLKRVRELNLLVMNYIKWGFESRLKPGEEKKRNILYYIKWGFESRLKLVALAYIFHLIKQLLETMKFVRNIKKD